MFSALLVAVTIASLARGSAFEPRHAAAHHHLAGIVRQVTTTNTPPTTGTATPVPSPATPTAGAPAGTTSAVTSAPAPSSTGPVIPGAPGTSAASSAAAVPSASIVFSSGKPTLTVDTYKPGTTAPIAGAPVLPDTFKYVAAEWPKGDTLPETTSSEVKTWMKELEGHDIPALAPTVDGSCVGDPAAAADAAKRGWWTCGGYTRDTDIVACPDKGTWGLTFDDGPGAYTPTLLKFLDEKALSATFFVVGTRVVERPSVLLEEYMSGHEISVHTWSHSKPLTSLTNEQIVAELGWTRKAIQSVLGVSPTTMRPPWGDIDDRVRAISLAMGLIPVMWTRTAAGVAFDTNDWRVPGGTVTVDASLSTFNSILGNASTLETGFITLEHDIHEVTVDMAINFTLNKALTSNPPFKLQAIGECMKYPDTDMYRETTLNKTFPYPQNKLADVTGGTVPTTAQSSGNRSSSSDSTSATKGNSATVVSPISGFSGFLALLAFVAAAW